MGKGPLKSKMKREIEVQPAAAAEPKSRCGSETFSHCYWKKRAISVEDIQCHMLGLWSRWVLWD